MGSGRLTPEGRNSPPAPDTMYGESESREDAALASDRAFRVDDIFS